MIYSVNRLFRRIVDFANSMLQFDAVVEYWNRETGEIYSTQEVYENTVDEFYQSASIIGELDQQQQIFIIKQMVGDILFR